MAGRIGRVLLVLYPLAMAFALVYSAEHYVLEVVMGAIYTVVVIRLVDRVELRWRERAPAAVVALPSERATIGEVAAGN